MAPRPRLRAGRPLVLLAAVCLARIASVSGQEYGSRLAYGSWEDYTAVAGRDGRQVALGPLPSMQEVSNNRTKRAVPVEKEWIVLAGYRPELAEPSPTILPDGRLVKVEVRLAGARCQDAPQPMLSSGGRNEVNCHDRQIQRQPFNLLIGVTDSTWDNTRKGPVDLPADNNVCYRRLLLLSAPDTRQLAFATGPCRRANVATTTG